MPQVSVIVPVYRVEKYIQATLTSILQQTYSDFELLIIDDGSPDRSIELCRQFTDPRIKIIQQQNRGLAGARNTGIRHAQGQYLAFLDSDDLWLPHKLEHHVQHLDNNPCIGLSFSRSAFIDEQGQPLKTYQMPKLKGISAIELLRCNPIGNGSAAVIRRQVFEEIQFSDNLSGTPETCYFDERFRQAEDLECWLRIALNTTWEIAGIPEALTLYRVNTGGLSASLQKQREYLEQVLDKACTYAPLFMKDWKTPAQAYQLLYLSRSAVRMKMGSTALQLLQEALSLHPELFQEEPRRIFSIAAAACLLCFLPRPIYAPIETLMNQLAGLLQKRQIQQDQSQQLST